MNQLTTTKADTNTSSPYEKYEDELVALLQMPGVDVKPLPKIEALELPRQTERPQIFVLVNGTEFAERESWPSWPNWEPFNASYSSARRTGGENWGFSMSMRPRNPACWLSDAGRENAHLL